MNEEQSTKPLLSGIIYGECAFWLAIIGMVVAIIGILIYLGGVNQYFDPQVLINGLWEGKDADTIWREASKEGGVLYGHWYLGNLAFSDALAMLGIGISCLGGVIGAWGAVAGMIINKEKPYLFLIFALVIAIILVCSAAGLISIH